MKRFIILLLTSLIINFIPIPSYSETKGFKKLITIKESGNLIRNPNFIELEIEDDNLKKNSDSILIDSKTNKEIPFFILNQEDKKIKIRFELPLNKNEEKTLEFRFNTGEKRTELKKISFTYPNFVGTEFYGISFEKIYIVGLKESDVKVTTKDGKSLFEGKVKYGQFKRVDLASPQVFYIKSTGPIMVISSSIGEIDKNEPQDKSDDDLTYLIGSEGVVYTPKNLFVSSFSDNNKVYIEDAGGKLIYDGIVNKTSPLSFTFKYPSVLLFKSTNPILIQYGNFDDSPFLPIIPYKGSIIANSFSDLTIFSPEESSSFSLNLFKSKKSIKESINKNELKEIETDIEGFDYITDKFTYLYTFGKSSNFGGEQILSTLGNSLDNYFSFITGKISTKYSTGHKRVVYVLSIYNDTEVNIYDLNKNKTQKVTLQRMSIYQYETEQSKSKLEIKSNKSVLIFETSNHLNREIFFSISPIKDESINVVIGKTETIGTPITPPTKPEKPQGKKPKVEIPTGILNIILWEISLLPQRLLNFINNIKLIGDLIKNIEFIKFTLPKFSIKLPEFIDNILPPFLKGINFILILILLVLLIILIFIIFRRRAPSKIRSSLEEIEEIEIPHVSGEFKKEEKEPVKVEPIEEITLEEKREEIQKEKLTPEKERLELKETLETKEEIKMEETLPVVPMSERPRELIPKELISEKVIDTTILKGKVVLDRKALMRIIELDLFPFLQEAYINSKAVSDLPVKYRTSEKIKPIELTKYEESMAEDLGKRVGGSIETGEALAIALKLKIDKCIVGERFNKVFQNINIYSFERLG